MTVRKLLVKHLIKMFNGETLIHEDNGNMISIVKRTAVTYYWFEIWENGSKTHDDMTIEGVLRYVFDM